VFAFVVLDLVFSMQEIGWELECVQNDLFCIKWGVKP